MSTIAEKLSYVDENVTKIRQSVTNKSGVDVMEVPLADIPPVIDGMARVNGNIMDFYINEAKYYEVGDFVNCRTSNHNVVADSTVTFETIDGLPEKYDGMNIKITRIYNEIKTTKINTDLILLLGDYDADIYDEEGTKNSSVTITIASVICNKGDRIQVVKNLYICESDGTQHIETVNIAPINGIDYHNYHQIPVFVTLGTNGSSNKLAALWFSINFDYDDNITGVTVGDIVQLSTVDKTGSSTVVMLDSDTAFIAHCYNTTYLLYGMVVSGCRYGGITIKVKDTAIISANGSLSGTDIDAIKMSDEKILITTAYGSTNLLYAVACTVSDTAITKGTALKINGTSESGRSGNRYAVRTENDKAIIIYRNNYEFTAYLISINNVTLTVLDSKGIYKSFEYNINSSYKEVPFILGHEINDGSLYIFIGGADKEGNNIITSIELSFSDRTISYLYPDDYSTGVVAPEGYLYIRKMTSISDTDKAVFLKKKLDGVYLPAVLIIRKWLMLYKNESQNVIGVLKSIEGNKASVYVNKRYEAKMGE